MVILCQFFLLLAVNSICYAGFSIRSEGKRVVPKEKYSVENIQKVTDMQKVATTLPITEQSAGIPTSRTEATSLLGQDSLRSIDLRDSHAYDAEKDVIEPTILPKPKDHSLTDYAWEKFTTLVKHDNFSADNLEHQLRSTFISAINEGNIADVNACIAIDEYIRGQLSTGSFNLVGDPTIVDATIDQSNYGKYGPLLTSSFPDVKAKRDITSLQYAIKSNQPEMVQFLIDKNKNIVNLRAMSRRQKSQNLTTIEYAIERKYGNVRPIPEDELDPIFTILCESGEPLKSSDKQVQESINRYRQAISIIPQANTIKSKGAGTPLRWRQRLSLLLSPTASPKPSQIIAADQTVRIESLNQDFDPDEASSVADDNEED